MNKRQATELGYVFQGAYSHYKEEMKERALELRKLGNKAVVVNVPTDPLSRGHHGMGYSVYWLESDENVKVRKQAEAERKYNILTAERQTLTERIKEIDRLLNGGN